MLSELQINRIVDNIIRHEGGYVNHPADRGGPTKYGITWKTLAAYRGIAPTAANYEQLKNLVKDLTISEAKAIYRSNYVEVNNFCKLPFDLAEVVIDHAVLSGTTAAARLLQRVLTELGGRIRVDGQIGPKTLDALAQVLAEHGLQKTVDAVVDERIRFYESIVVRDPSQRVFLRGWCNRANSFRSIELDLDERLPVEKPMESTTVRSAITTVGTAAGSVTAVVSTASTLPTTVLIILSIGLVCAVGLACLMVYQRWKKGGLKLPIVGEYEP